MHAHCPHSADVRSVVYFDSVKLFRQIFRLWENGDLNNNRVNEANNENEIWNIAKEVSEPRCNSQWELKSSETNTTKDHQIIADTFNSFFSNKVMNLQANIL